MSKAKKNEKQKVLEGAALELDEIRHQIKELEAREKGVGAQIRAILEELETPVFESAAVKAQIVEKQRSGLDRGLLSQVLSAKQLEACTKVTHYFQLTITKRS